MVLGVGMRDRLGKVVWKMKCCFVRKSESNWNWASNNVIYGSVIDFIVVTLA